MLTLQPLHIIGKLWRFFLKNIEVHIAQFYSECPQICFPSYKSGVRFTLFKNT